MSNNYVPFAVLPVEGLDPDRLPMELRRHVANGHRLYTYGSYEMRRKAPAFRHGDIRRSLFCENSCCIR